MTPPTDPATTDPATTSPAGTRPAPAAIGRRRPSTWLDRADAEIEVDLRALLAERTDGERVEVVVMDGVVTLTGRLDAQSDTEVVRRSAIAVNGVRRVNDWLTSDDDPRDEDRADLGA